MLNKTNKIIESFLPVFPGFYNTIFEPNEDMVIESPFTYDNYKFFYDEYREKIAKACVNGISEALKEFGIKGVKIEYERIKSPREYNFDTDAIYVKYKLTVKAIQSINKYLKTNKEAFANYIKERYTSRDGFMSWYSNDINDWEGYLVDYGKLKHCFGAVLEFICRNENFTTNDLYNTCEGIYLEGELNNGTGEINDHIIGYTNDNYKNGDVQTITNKLVEYFDENYGGFFTVNRFERISIDFLTPKYIKDIVLNIFNSIEKNTLSLF